MSEDTVWTVFLTSAPGAAATPAGPFVSREAALAWTAALPEHVRRRALPPLPQPGGQRAA